MGSALGPAPFPEIVRDFQSVIGREAKRQYAEISGGKLPDAVMASIGGGSNAIGMFYPFVNDKSVAMYGAEASGLGLDTEKHAATFAKGRPGILHGALMDVLQDAHGQIMEAFSISAGLAGLDCYPKLEDLRWLCFKLLSRLEGIIPALVISKIGVAAYDSITDEEALEGFKLLSFGRYYPWTFCGLLRVAQKVATRRENKLIVCLSGRGDKDVMQVKERFEAEAEGK